MSVQTRTLWRLFHEGVSMRALARQYGLPRRVVEERLRRRSIQREGTRA